jgi:hypothetical protein
VVSFFYSVKSAAKLITYAASFAAKALQVTAFVNLLKKESAKPTNAPVEY